MSAWLPSWLPIRRAARADVVGLDVGGPSTKVVRLRRMGDGPTVVAADVLPRLAAPAPGAPETQPDPLPLPKALQGVHAAMAVTTPHTSVRLLVVPGGQEKADQLNFNELLTIPEGLDYRVGYDVLSAENRSEWTLLAAALPQSQARWAAMLLPHGLPALCSLQVGGVATLNAVSAELAAHHGDACALSVEVGTERTNVSAFHKGRLALFRQCAIGSQTLLHSVQQRFGVEDELAPGILEDGVIDASQTVAEAIEPFLRQLVLAREFVERKRMCRIEKILLCGTLLGARHWCARIEAITGIVPVVWDPLAVVPVASGACTDRVKGLESRFAAAMGAALAVLEAGSDLPH